MGEMRNEYKILVATPEGERLFGLSRRRWEGNTRIYLTERLGWQDVSCMHMAEITC